MVPKAKMNVIGKTSQRERFMQGTARRQVYVCDRAIELIEVTTTYDKIAEMALDQYPIEGIEFQRVL